MRSQPRTSPPEATFRALEALPAPPQEIQKVDAVVVLSNRNNRKLSWKLRFFDRRREGGISHSNPATSEASTSRDYIPEISTEYPLTATSNIDEADTISRSLPVLDQPSNIAAASTPARSSQVNDCSVQTVPKEKPDQSELVLDSKAETISSSNPIQGGDTAGSTKEPIRSTVGNADPVESERLRGQALEVEPTQSKTNTDARQTKANQLRPLQCISPHCYVAFDSPVGEQHQTEYDQKLRRRLTSFLESLKLKDKNVLFGCFAASTSPNRQNLGATIIFFCLNSDQQKTISSALKRRDSMNLEVVPSSRYRTAVVVQEIRLSSSEISVPSNPGPISGQIVYAFLQNKPSLCGVLCRISTSSMAPQCMLGGLIAVSGSVYALTVSHAFLGRGKAFRAADNSDGEYIPR